LSTYTSSVKGFPGAISSTLITLYKRRWLIKYLVQRQFASSYRSSYLGLVWMFLGPLIMVALFTLVFSEVLGLRFREVTGDSSINFGLFLYCGLLPYLAWAQAMSQGVKVISRNRGLVESVIFPLEILPLTSGITTLIQSFLGVPVLMLVLVVLEQRLEWTAFLLPLVMVPQLLFTLGIGYLIAIAGTYVPDIGEALRGVVRATFFITPIIWPPERIPENFRFLVDYNPLAFLVEAYRNLILDGKLPDAMATIYFSLFALALFVVGFAAFNRVKHNFAGLL
jgi:ABC-2 type transport system permease protein